MKEIIMVRNSGEKLIVNVDDEDFEGLSRYNWRTLSGRSMNIYTWRHSTKQERSKGYPQNVIMHRQILGVILKPDVEVDHRDGNGLNNMKENLRVATRSQNNMNRISRSGTTSIYKGVSWNREKSKWEAYIRYESKQYKLGYFNDERDAALAYNNKAKELFGEFARFNDLPPRDEEEIFNHHLKKGG